MIDFCYALVWPSYFLTCVLSVREDYLTDQVIRHCRYLLTLQWWSFLDSIHLDSLHLVSHHLDSRHLIDWLHLQLWNAENLYMKIKKLPCKGVLQASNKNIIWDCWSELNKLYWIWIWYSFFWFKYSSVSKIIVWQKQLAAKPYHPDRDVHTGFFLYKTQH